MYIYIYIYSIHIQTQFITNNDNTHNNNNNNTKLIAMSLLTKIKPIEYGVRRCQILNTCRSASIEQVQFPARKNLVRGMPKRRKCPHPGVAQGACPCPNYVK